MTDAGSLRSEGPADPEEILMRRLIALTSVLIVALVLGLSVAGNVLAADGQLTHTGRVLVSVGGDVTLPADEQADVLVVVNGNAVVEGKVNTIVVVEGTATLRGAMTETLFVANGRADIDALSEVVHGVRQVGSAVDAPPDVSVTDMSGDLVGFGVFMGTAAILLWVGIGVATLVLGLALAAIAARQLRSATDLISHEPGTTAIAGLLGLVVPPLLAVLAIVTLIGIPLGFGLLIIIWPMFAFAGYIVGALWIGLWLQGRRAAPIEQPGRPYGAMVIGLLITFVLGFVPLFTFVVSFFGMGAVLLATWRTLRGGASRLTAPRAQPAPVAG
jgi:hypothetical protein